LDLIFVIFISGQLLPSTLEAFNGN